MKKYFVVSLMLLVSLGGYAPPVAGKNTDTDIQSAESKVKPEPAATVKADELIVKLKEGVDASYLQESCLTTAKFTAKQFESLDFCNIKPYFRTTLGKPEDRYGLARIYVIPTIAGAEQALKDRLVKEDKIEYIEQNARRMLQFTPNDPQYGQQWALANTGQMGGTPDADIDADLAWDTTTGSSDIVVAVIDSGVDFSHEDLQGTFWTNPNEIPGNGIDDDANGFVDDVQGWDFVNHDNDPVDDLGHGTHVAGIIGANTNNGIGVAGICGGDAAAGLPGCKLMILKSCKPDGSCINVAQAIEYASNPDGDPATDDGADVINLSLGSNSFSQVEQDAIDTASDRGSLIVAAAGNYGSETPLYPAACEHVIGVAATDRHDHWAYFSNYGDWVDISAPGDDILSTYIGNSYSIQDGTSMAAPVVAGAVALFKSHMVWYQDRILTASADDIYNDNFEKIAKLGAGRVNANNPMLNLTIPEAVLLDPISGGYNSAEIEVWGTAQIFASVPSTTVNWTLDYANLTNGIWQTQHLTYLKNQNAQQYAQHLAEWDVSNLADGFYALRLRAADANYPSRSVRAYSLVHLDHSSFWFMQPGWPQETNDIASPLVMDLEAYFIDETKQQIVVSDASTLAIYDYDGRTYSGWPQTVASTIHGAPAAVDPGLGNGNSAYIFATTRDPGKVYGFGRGGGVLTGWETPKEMGEMWVVSPVIGDIDHNGVFDVLASDVDYGIRVWDTSGTVKWSAAIPSGIAHATPAVADLDGDGFAEIVVGALGGQVYLLQHDGNKQLIASLAGNTIEAAPVIGDLEQNGSELEIVQASFTSWTSGLITALDRFGTIKWTRSMPAASYAPALGNIDADPELEIVVGDFAGNLHVIQSDGSESILASIGAAFKSQVVLGDINSDSQADIVAVAADGKLYAWDSSGNQLVAPYQLTGTNEHSAPSLADIDRDGDVDIVVVTQGYPSGAVSVLDTKGVYDPAAIEWWTYHSNEQRTGCYKTDCAYRGDADVDGKVTSWDAALVYQHLNGTVSLSPSGYANAIVAAEPYDQLTQDDASAMLRCSVYGGYPPECYE